MRNTYLHVISRLQRQVALLRRVRTTPVLGSRADR